MKATAAPTTRAWVVERAAEPLAQRRHGDEQADDQRGAGAGGAQAQMRRDPLLELRRGVGGAAAVGGWLRPAVRRRQCTAAAAAPRQAQRMRQCAPSHARWAQTRPRSRGSPRSRLGRAPRWTERRRQRPAPASPQAIARAPWRLARAPVRRVGRHAGAGAAWFCGPGLQQPGQGARTLAPAPLQAGADRQVGLGSTGGAGEARSCACGERPD